MKNQVTSIEQSRRRVGAEPALPDGLQTCRLLAVRDGESAGHPEHRPAGSGADRRDCKLRNGIAFLVFRAGQDSCPRNHQRREISDDQRCRALCRVAERHG